MTARLLTLLALALPLMACAAVPADGAGAAVPAQQQAVPQTAASPASATPAAASAAARTDAPTPATASSRIAAPVRGTTAGSADVAAPNPHPAATAANATTVGDAAPAAASSGATDATTPAPDAAATTPALTPRPAPPVTVAPVTMPSGSATGSLLQTFLALIVVLGVLAGLAWFLKRYGPKATGGTANLRVVGSLSLGGRERVLVVEVGDQWIVVGASPGRINALATLPRQEGKSADAMGSGHATLAPHTQPARNFADWLKQTIDKRK